jgi:hypothetical protein
MICQNILDELANKVQEIAIIERHEKFFLYADKGATRFWEESIEIKTGKEKYDEIVSDPDEYEESDVDIIPYLRKNKRRCFIMVQVWSSVSDETSRKIAEILLDVMKKYNAVVEVIIADSDRNVIFDPDGTMMELAWYESSWVEIKDERKWTIVDFFDTVKSEYGGCSV